MINEDLVLTLESTSGRMRVYPQDGLWTVEALNTAETGQTPATITGVELFSDAIRMMLGALYNPAGILEAEEGLKSLVLAGLGGLEEYREKALAKAEGI